MTWRNVTVRSSSKKGVYFENSCAEAVGIRRWWDTGNTTATLFNVLRKQKHWHTNCTSHSGSKCPPEYKRSKMSGSYKWEWFQYAVETGRDSAANLSVLEFKPAVKTETSCILRSSLFCCECVTYFPLFFLCKTLHQMASKQHPKIKDLTSKTLLKESLNSNLKLANQGQNGLRDLIPS